MTTIVERDPVLAEVFASALDKPTVLLASLDQVEEYLRRHTSEHVIVLGPSVDVEAAVEFAGRNQIARPALGVILVRPTVDNAILADALRSGMREVVETRDSSGLRDAVHRAETFAQAVAGGLEHSEAEAAVGSLVTVFSTKGGVGKSFLATNLGAALADDGKRVCIVDLDVHCGDVAIMLQLSPLHSLADLSQLSGVIDTSGVESLLTDHSDGLTVLAAPVQLGSPVPAEPIARLLETLKGMFDVVVVDTSGMFDDYVLPALDNSDEVVLVGTLDIPALKSLKLAVGTLDLLNVSRERWRFVLNRADSKVGLSAGEFEETLGLKPDITLPTSRDVLMAVNRGEVIVRSDKGHQISKAVAGFARSLARQPEAPGTAAEISSRPTHARRGAPRRGLLSRKGA